MTYTREQLIDLKNKLHDFASDAMRDMLAQPYDRHYYAGKRHAYEAAASQVLALIESEEEVPA